jgi:hypothetical protein
LVLTSLLQTDKSVVYKKDSKTEIKIENVKLNVDGEGVPQAKKK